MAANDVYACTVHGIIGSKNVANVFHVRQISPDDGNPLEQQVAEGIATIWQADIAPTQGIGVSLTAVSVKCISPTPRQTVVTPISVTGTALTAPMPPGMGVCISMYTDSAARSHRGRIWFCGIAKGYISNTNLDPAASLFMNGWFANMTAAWTGTSGTVTFRMGLWSHHDSAFRLYSYASLNPNVRSIRGRRSK